MGANRSKKSMRYIYVDGAGHRTVHIIDTDEPCVRLWQENQPGYLPLCSGYRLGFRY